MKHQKPGVNMELIFLDSGRLIMLQLNLFFSLVVVTATPGNLEIHFKSSDYLSFTSRGSRNYHNSTGFQTSANSKVDISSMVVFYCLAEGIVVGIVCGLLTLSLLIAAIFGVRMKR